MSDPGNMAGVCSPAGGWRIDRSYAQDDVSAPRDARRAIAGHPSVATSLREDLTIVVSELVANAVRHAPRVPGGRIALSVTGDGTAVRVEVRDPGRGFDGTPGPATDGGMGLLVVSRIATDWGISALASTLVWCTITVPP